MTDSTATARIPSPVGTLVLVARDGRLAAVRFSDAKPQAGPPPPELEGAVRQLGEYFAGRRRVFDIPLEPAREPLVRLVSEGLAGVSYGERISYGALTERIGLPSDRVRAVGAALGRNPLAIVVPCHRVVGSDGSLVGFGGGLERKARLLELEAPQLQLGV
jgi:methylated-DNA-[protein]-cysteine S-methyltransferase